MIELDNDLELEEDTDDETEEAEDEVKTKVEKPQNRYRKATCPLSDGEHLPVQNVDRRHTYAADYICAYCGKTTWSKAELEEIANQLLREDSNAELCRVCKEDTPDSLPYGQETGHVEWQIQKDKEGNVLLDDEDNALYVGFPELRCEKGHRWYKGEGPRRNINGKDPILFEQHLYNRKRREIQVKEGVPDPAYTMDRWNKRPTQGLYHRVHPLGRKTNTKEQRAKHGASFYR